MKKLVIPLVLQDFHLFHQLLLELFTDTLLSGDFNIEWHVVIFLDTDFGNVMERLRAVYVVGSASKGDGNAFIGLENSESVAHLKSRLRSFDIWLVVFDF